MGIITQNLITKLQHLQVVPLITLPTEIVTEILIRLPAKTLARCKVVCKTWHDLIKSRDFSIHHIEHSLATHSNLHFIFATPKLKWGDFDSFANPIELNYPLINPSDYDQEFIGCIDGLVCLITYYHHLCYNLHFLNPTTKTHRVLYHLPAFPEELSWSKIADPTPSLIYGFGCNRMLDDYKFVRIFQYHRADTGYSYNKVMVYSVKSNMWHTVSANITFKISCSRNCGVFFNGALHWVNDVDSGEPDQHLMKSIVGFSLSENTVFEVGVPRFGSECHVSVGVLDECLCVMLSSRFWYEIWALKEYGVVSSWTMLYRLKKASEIDIMQELIGYTKNRKQLLVKLVSHTVTRINLETMEIEHVAPLDNSSQLRYAHVCTENLSMLDESIYALKEKKTKKSRMRLSWVRVLLRMCFSFHTSSRQT